MRGYAISTCKIREKTPFAQNSRSKKEYPFLLDQDVDLGPLSRSKQIKDDQEQLFNANNHDTEKSLLRRDPHWLFKGQWNGEVRKQTAMRPATLRRNFSATSLHQGNKSSSIMLERPSSSRSDIPAHSQFTMQESIRQNNDHLDDMRSINCPTAFKCHQTIQEPGSTKLWLWLHVVHESLQFPALYR
ncbi:LOW QUALITY PROTEIN: hypothetical protein Cgig2_009329 [Carnegiea gigantea]|uniref:Uncharacterized protein n=1 Tax=Carnegiea gigantea TaxID=171969 RepID=A0A9Q1JX95_9CARY|nr:LOW QUALITY PROTEIN: hypothetical protein Cgig2_009329 [Carnegiea gigantea]